MSDTIHKTPTPTCPHCGHAMTIDDMLDCQQPDLFALAPMEEKACITCPVCDLEYWVQGGYTTHYTTAFAEELL